MPHSFIASSGPDGIAPEQRILTRRGEGRLELAGNLNTALLHTQQLPTAV